MATTARSRSMVFKRINTIKNWNWQCTYVEDCAESQQAKRIPILNGAGYVIQQRMEKTLVSQTQCQNVANTLL